MEKQSFDQQKAEAFADKLLGMLNHGGLAILTSIGHRTGLFDAMQNLPPSTSQAIADAAGLNERYVREWLGGMVVSRVVDYKPEGGLYSLPPEHAAFLTRKAEPDNIAVFAQYIGTMGMVEDKIVDCFKHGGGVPYSAYPRFHQVMAEDSGQTVVAALTKHILPLVEGLQDRLGSGIEVLDVGCGSGRALNLMARAYPASRFVGYDFSEEAIERAASQADELGLDNLRFEVKDVARLDGNRDFDLITAFDAIHDQATPDKVLAGINSCLRQDGVFLMQDIASSSLLENNLDHPVGPLLYALSTMHCMTVSLAQGGMGLGTMWGEEKAREMLAQAGFSRVEVKKLPHDFQNSFYVIRP
jgi:2-polyprenyl-3-methyl-5-hydroxy-6-metoxy-1,4-benzoquinol methylase